MSLTALQVVFLQSLAANPTVRQSSKSAQFFGENYALGVRVGRQWEYTQFDAEKAAALLQSLGLPVVEDVRAEADRSSASSRPGLSEKTGTVAPHANSVAVLALGMPVPCSDSFLTPQPFGYAVATVAEVGSCTPDLVVVVENLETFRQIRRYRWLIDLLPRQASILVLYRGDKRINVGDASAALQCLRAPVWAAFDFDPAGLGMAAALDRLEKVLLPPRDVLERSVRQGARYDLWADQQEQYFDSLERCLNPAIQEPWGWLKALKCGLPQEWMTSADSHSSG